MIREMDKDIFINRMETYMKEPGKMIWEMVMEPNCIITEINIKENGNKI